MKKYIHSFIWLFLILTYAVVIFALIFTGKIYQFLHPRMVPILVIGGLIILGMVVVQTKNILNGKAPKSSWEAFLFILPILLLTSAMHEDAATELGETRPLMGMENNSSIGDSFNKEADLKSLDFNDANFFPLILDVFNNPDLYVGEEIKISGLIQNRDTWPEDRFMVSRMAISCCVADAITVGFSFYADDFDIIPGDWMEIKGKVVMLPFENPDTKEVEDFPSISIESAKTVEWGQIYVY